MTIADGIDTGDVTLTPDSYIVGAITTHTLSFETPVPLYESFVIQIFVPEDCDTPMDSELFCRG